MKKKGKRKIREPAMARVSSHWKAREASSHCPLRHHPKTEQRTRMISPAIERRSAWQAILNCTTKIRTRKQRPNHRPDTGIWKDQAFKPSKTESRWVTQ